MILPDKYLELDRSLLGIGALVLERLDEPTTASALWYRMHELPEIGTFEKFTLALDFLYAIGTLGYEDGLLRRLRL